MSLREIVDSVERREKTLTVFNPDDGEAVVDDLADYFGDRNLEVRGESTPSGRPREFAVLDVDGVVLSAVELSALRDLVASVPTGLDSEPVEDEAYSEVLQHVSEQTFTSYSTEEMTAATREIEDRAHRVGSGTMHVGFQTLRNLRVQADRYRDLAELGLDLTLYATPDGDVPDVRSADVVVTDAPDVEDHWFVAFDGGDAKRQECALLAEERAPGQFYGFWTYDPDVVERIFDELRGREDLLSA